MAKAIWNGATLVESDDVEIVEGNVYFPASAVNMAFMSDSDHRTSCWWKGTASYYDVIVDGETNPAACWYYPEPKPRAAKIQDRVAFWRGVEVVR